MDLANLSIKCSVVLVDGTKIPCDGNIELSVEYGKTYAYTLLGNESEGFKLSKK